MALPGRLIDAAVAADGAIEARYLTLRDERWVQPLQDALEGAVGEPRHEVDARIACLSPDGVRPRAARAMQALLLRLHGFGVSAPIDPQVIRRTVFDMATESADEPVNDVWARAAARLDVTPDLARSGLYADLPPFRTLNPLPEAVTTPALIGRYNLALAQALLFRAERLRVMLRSRVKEVLRFARLQRLLVKVMRRPDAEAWTVIDVSGPLSLFRQTTKYGHAMARWLPALTRVPEWRLVARCVLGDRRGVFRASHRDPIGTTHARGRRFDSQLEARFFKDMLRLAPQWEVLREAQATAVGARIVCPDFTLVHRSSGLVVPVELVGFWTPEYLADKRAVVRSLRAKGVRWVLCVDRRLAAAEDAASPLVASPDVFFFDRRVRAADLVAYLDVLTPRRPG